MFHSEEDFDGKLVRGYYIQCALGGECGNWIFYFDDPVPNMRKAEKHFRALGWSKTKEAGWVCPNHKEIHGSNRKAIEQYEADSKIPRG